MTAVDTPTLRPEKLRLREDNVTIDCSVIRGVPGGPAGEEFIILLKPDPKWPKGELHVVVNRGKEYLRSWTTETLFKDSPNFPDGIEVGLIQHHTDTGIGQPFIERSLLQITDDQMLRLQAYAHNEPYLSITERRRLAKESERFQQQKKAGRAIEPGMKSPDDVLAEFANDKLNRKIEELVAKGVADALAKRGQK